VSGEGTLDPSGAGALTIPTGASETSAPLTAVRHNGNDKALTVTATVHGTNETLTLVLSSDTPTAASEGLTTPRELLLFAVVGGSLLGLVALFTMPIPRRRRARRRKA
jgi:hypothetical protein